MLLNPYNTDAFNMVSLTQAINLLPNNYGRLREMNLFPVKGIRTRTMVIEEKHGVLNLLPTKPVGSPGTVGKIGKRKVRSFVIPHIPHDDVILPDEYQDVRAFGSETQLQTLSGVMTDKLQTMQNKHVITLEHLRWGALKGKILDADASELFNLYTEFEITAKSINFVLGTDTTDVAKKCREVVRHVEKNLRGEVMKNVHAMVSEEFFDKLIAHPNVEKFFLNHVAGLQRIVEGADPRKGFAFGGIVFEEHVGNAPDPDGNSRRFIAANEGHAFPFGTQDTFSTVCAPADMIQFTNTKGQLFYASREIRDHGRGVDIHTQSNPLPICSRPGVLVKLTTT